MFEDIAKLFSPPTISFEKDWPDFRLFAIRRHRGQMYGEFPYAYHLAMVECILAEYGFTDFHYQAAAWLHDVVEDTDTELNDIYANYGPLVATIIHAVTGEGNNRKERNASIYAKLAKCPEAAVVKTADRIANMQTGRIEMRRDGAPNKVQMYLKEWDTFRSKLSPLLNDDIGFRLIWEALEGLVEKCQQEVANYEADKKEAKELLLTQKSGGTPEAIPPLGDEE